MSRRKRTRKCELIPFPMTARTGKIRDVAAKMLDRPSEKSVAHYQRVVNESLQSQFNKIGLPFKEQKKQIRAFWEQVEIEMERVSQESQGDIA